MQRHKSHNSKVHHPTGFRPTMIQQGIGRHTTHISSPISANLPSTTASSRAFQTRMGSLQETVTTTVQRPQVHTKLIPKRHLPMATIITSHSAVCMNHTSQRQIVKLSSVKPSTDASGCTSTGCSTHGSEATPAKKPVCDPYGLDNKALSHEDVQFHIDMVLGPSWTYDTNTNTLNKTYPFPKVNRTAKNVIIPPLIAHTPGSPEGPRHGPGACFLFAQVINNVCVNNDHWLYALSINPRRCEVFVSLKTVGRPGVTHADFNLASHFDSFYDTHMKF